MSGKACSEGNMKTKVQSSNSSKIGIFETVLAGVPCRSNRGWFGYCTVVLFPMDNEWALFDTGHYSDRALLRDVLNQRGIEPDDIRHVILSHLHFDHVLNLPLFKNAEITLCEAEIRYAEDVKAGLVVDDAIPDFWPALLEGRRIHTFKDELEVGDGLEVVRLPGHTPGCLGLFHAGSPSVAVCGDVIKNGWELISGSSTSQNWSDDLSRKSIAKIKQRGEVIIPGHDRPIKMRKRGLEYIDGYSWEIYGNVFPQPQNQIIHTLDLPCGFYQEP